MRTHLRRCRFARTCNTRARAAGTHVRIHTQTAPRTPFRTHTMQTSHTHAPHSWARRRHACTRARRYARVSHTDRAYAAAATEGPVSSPDLALSPALFAAAVAAWSGSTFCSVVPSFSSLRAWSPRTPAAISADAPSALTLLGVAAPAGAAAKSLRRRAWPSLPPSGASATKPLSAPTSDALGAPLPAADALPATAAARRATKSPGGGRIAAVEGASAICSVGAALAGASASSSGSAASDRASLAKAVPNAQM